MFGRASNTLGIGPQSSYLTFTVNFSFILETWSSTFATQHCASSVYHTGGLCQNDWDYCWKVFTLCYRSFPCTNCRAKNSFWQSSFSFQTYRSTDSNYSTVKLIGSHRPVLLLLITFWPWELFKVLETCSRPLLFKDISYAYNAEWQFVLSYDQLRPAALIGRNVITWRWS